MQNRLIHPKVAKAGGIGAALGVLVVGLVSRIHGIDLTPAEGGAIAAIVGYLAAFLPVSG